MHIMTQSVFDTAINGFWAGYAAVLKAEEELGKLNLTVGETVISHIKELKDAFIDNSMELMDMDESMKETVRETLERFITDSVSQYGIMENFTAYPNARVILFRCFGQKAVFNTEHVQKDKWMTKHRALTIDGLKPVTGYILPYGTRTFMITEETYATFDPMAHIITATDAVEVHQATVAPDFGITDDDNNRLYEGDVLRTGDEEFVLRSNNRFVLLHLENRKVNGLHRVRTNYDSFRAKMMENEKMDGDKKPAGNNNPRLKVIMRDGILVNILCNEAAKEVDIDIVDADSDVDSDDALREELEEAGFTSRGNTSVRHPRE